MRYFIYKRYRDVQLGQKSYAGPAWDGAGIRDQYREYWTEPETPLALAKVLQSQNPVGFEVWATQRMV